MLKRIIILMSLGMFMGPTALAGELSSGQIRSRVVAGRCMDKYNKPAANVGSGNTASTGANRAGRIVTE